MRSTLDGEPLPLGATGRATRPRVAVLTAVPEHPHAGLVRPRRSRDRIADVDRAPARAVGDL